MKKRKRFNNLPIAAKLWILFFCVVIPCIVTLSIIFFHVLNYTRDESVYSSINKAQQLLAQKSASSDSSGGEIVPSEYDAVVSVYHIGIIDRQVKYMTFPTAKFAGVSTRFLNIMCTSYSEQTEPIKKYKIQSAEYNLYYVVAKNGNDGVISFRVDAVNNGVYAAALWVIIGVSAAGMLLSLLAAFLYARSIAKPLKILEAAATRMADGDLETPVALGSEDEIGHLSQQIDKARLKLRQRNFMRQSAIQYVSHELKTPVMTIGSYAQSILDNVYPRGNLEGSVKVIADQADRLERTIIKLIAITRLDYLDSRPVANSLFDLSESADETAARICYTRPELDVRLDLERAECFGPREQIEVMIENLLENAVRYAARKVRVWVGMEGSAPVFRVYNDGGGIPPDELEGIFEEYKKGKKGITGLGLSIVKRTAEACGAELRVVNVEEGVEFKVKFKPQT